MALLEVKGLSCGYGGEDVIKNISFAVTAGEVISLAGANGCGKTTLLRALCGSAKQSEGSVFIGDKQVSDMPPRERAKRIAMLSQTGAGGEYFGYTVMETVLMGRYARQRARLFSEETAEDKAAAKKYIEVTGLKGLEQRSITALSGGQLQRVLLARAFAQEPDILLLDEPANHLDIKSQKELAELLRRFANEGKAVIGVFHDISFAAFVSDRILLMRSGEKVMYEAVPHVLKSECLSEFFGMDIRCYMEKMYEIWKGSC